MTKYAAKYRLWPLINRLRIARLTRERHEREQRAMIQQEIGDGD